MFLRSFVEKWPEPYKSQVRERVRGIMNQHYNKTNDPIVIKVKHPLSGVSWSMLCMVAIRGDFRGRKAPPLLGRDDQKAWDKYNAAREAEYGGK